MISEHKHWLLSPNHSRPVDSGPTDSSPGHNWIHYDVLKFLERCSHAASPKFLLYGHMRQKLKYSIQMAKIELFARHIHSHTIQIRDALYNVNPILQFGLLM